MSIDFKWDDRKWGEQPAHLPVDVMPCSNGEFLTPEPMPHHYKIMHLQEREVERWRRKFNMSRRQFVRTSAAMAIGFWSIDAASNGRWGNYAAAHNTETTDACDLEWAAKDGLETVQNLPGEFIFDIQSHHVDPEGPWLVTNPAMAAFFAAIWPQAGPGAGSGGRPDVRDDGSIRGFGAGEINPFDNLSRFHYAKELFLDSATTMTVLSCTPTSPDTNNPLPLAEAALTVGVVNAADYGVKDEFGKRHAAQRSIMHAFVMPNRGGAGMTQDQLLDPAKDIRSGPKPLYFDEEMDQMWKRAEKYGHILGGWKTYCAWGDVPYASGWQLDSERGMDFLRNVRAVSDAFPDVPPVVATHKGFALPGFDQRGAAPRDVGPAAKANPGVRFMIYHSGYDIFESGVPVGGEKEGPYPGDDKVDSSDRSVNAFIKSLRENNWSAENFKEPGKAFGNVPNVWAELGSVWREHISSPNAAVHLLGKLITHVGPKRIAWGTDSLWYGSPQREIVALRRLQFTQEAKELYNLPYGLDGDVEDPTQPAPSPDRTIRNGILGRNAAEAYNIDPDSARSKLDCDAVNAIRKNYVENLGDEMVETPAMRENTLHGARTRRDVLKELKEGPWTP